MERMKKKMNRLFFVNGKLIIMILIFISIFLCISGCSRGDPSNTPSSNNDASFITPLSSSNLAVIEPSGLIYNSKRGTLFSVGDNQPVIYELNTSGQVIGSITISANDMEGISFTPGNDTIYIVEETKKLLSLFTLQGKKITSYQLNIPTTSNNGPEGVAVNTNNGHIYIINSKYPGILIEYSSDMKEIKRTDISFSTDLSDICFDKKLNCLWLLSHDNKKVFKMDLSGTMIKSWSFDIVQAEGIAFSDDDKMYITSDSDSKFYIFNKPN
jgi:uncharacterized protein YjiK